jgi:hypothetical protein
MSSSEVSSWYYYINIPEQLRKLWMTLRLSSLSALGMITAQIWKVNDYEHDHYCIWLGFHTHPWNHRETFLSLCKETSTLKLIPGWKVWSTWSKNNKAILANSRGGLQGCETSRFAHYLDNPLTDGGKVVSRTRRWPLLLPQHLSFSRIYRSFQDPRPKLWIQDTVKR